MYHDQPRHGQSGLGSGRAAHLALLARHACVGVGAASSTEGDLTELCSRLVNGHHQRKTPQAAGHSFTCHLPPSRPAAPPKSRTKAGTSTHVPRPVRACCGPGGAWGASWSCDMGRRRQTSGLPWHPWWALQRCWPHQHPALQSWGSLGMGGRAELLSKHELGGILHPWQPLRGEASLQG